MINMFLLGVKGGYWEYLEKTIDLPQVTYKLYHILLYWVNLALAWAGFELTTLVVIGTDCIGSHKPNYHMVTTTTVPYKHGYTLSESKTSFGKY